MKKLFVFLIIVFIILENQIFPKIPQYPISIANSLDQVTEEPIYVQAKAETTTYAKVSAGCTLFKTETLENTIDNILFVIPETYFVMITKTISDNCFKVQYNEFDGYVDSASVIIATFVPIVKYLENITCDIRETSGTQVWSKPSATSNVLTTIPAGTKGISYIASAFGTIPSGGESNVWYFVNYTPISNSTNVYTGYIYSENTTNLTEIVSNTETNPEVISQNDGDYAIYISSPFRILIISIISVPIIILVLILAYKINKSIKIARGQKMENSSKQNYNFENSGDNFSNFESYNRNTSDPNFCIDCGSNQYYYGNGNTNYNGNENVSNFGEKRKNFGKNSSESHYGYYNPNYSANAENIGFYEQSNQGYYGSENKQQNYSDGGRYANSKQDFYYQNSQANNSKFYTPNGLNNNPNFPQNHGNWGNNQSENSVWNNGAGGIKERINGFKSKPLIKKIDSRKKNENYPAFPTYDSDDDLL